MADFTNIDGKYVKDVVMRDDIAYIKNAIGYDGILGIKANFDTGVVTRIAGARGLTAGTDFDSFAMYGGRRLCNLADNGTVNAYYGEQGYTEDGSNGQVMIEQPKFYYRFIPLQLREIVHQLGETTTAIANNSTTNPIMINEESVTAVLDDVATYGGSNFRWNGSKWSTVGADACGYHIIEGMWLISATPKTGFKLHPAFYNEAREPVERIYSSVYEGSIYDVSDSSYLKYDSWDVTENGDDTYTINSFNGKAADFNNDKLSSIAGVKPASGDGQNLSIENSEILANNRGAGWHIDTIKSISMEQLLFIIEYASFNSSIIGGGVTSYLDNVQHNNSAFTGSTSNIGNNTGIANSTSRLTNTGVYETNTQLGKVSCRYRGRENVWGNLTALVNGINIKGNKKTNGGVPYICSDYNFQKYKSDGNYKSVNYSCTPYYTIAYATYAKYIKYFGYGCNEYDWLFLSSSNNPSTLVVPDTFWVTDNLDGYRSMAFGGFYAESNDAGMFDISVSFYADNSSRYSRNSRLIYIPQS